MSDPTPDGSQFKNGNDIHFDYNEKSEVRKDNGDVDHQSLEESQQNLNQTSSSNKKKKKKKNKNKSKSIASPSDVHATLSNPDADYPTSRVIKQAPNGDVIVESLDEESNHSNNETPHPSSSANIWDNASIEEQENLKAFWESLGEPEKMELVKIDKKSIMEIFKNEAGAANNLSNHHLNSGKLNHNNNNQSNNNSNYCTCSYCGRKSSIIEDELENIYDNHFDDIIDFIHEVRDINDLNALPGLLFGGFHMLEEEHRLMKRQQRELNQLRHKHQYQRAQARAHEGQHQHSINHSSSDNHNHNHEHNHENCGGHDHHIEDYKKDLDFITDAREPDDLDSFIEKIKEIEEDEEEQEEYLQQCEDHEDHLDDENRSEKLLDQDLHKTLTDPTSASSSDKNYSDMLETQQTFDKCIEALKKLDIDKATLNPKNQSNSDISYEDHVDMLQKARFFSAHMRNLTKADKTEIEGVMTFVRNMTKLFSNGGGNFASEANLNGNLNEGSIEGLSTFAEEFMKTEGNSFIDMMESLSDSRTAREDLLREDPNLEEVYSQVPQQISKPTLNQLLEHNEVIEKNLADTITQKGGDEDHVQEEFLDEDGYDDDEYEEEEDDEEGYEDDDAEDDDDEEEESDSIDEEDAELDNEDEEHEVSDTESEISEEEKMQEIRRLFLIQVIKLFQERLKNSYKEKLSKDRTKKLIEELEAEENAKKEREDKKLKQKEKAKEKKRLQQLAKEEERKKKEEEARAKEEEIKRKQEELKADQKRRKDEARLKREEEKRKRIEELKRKEIENQKRLEAQRKKEEEAKKLKEERKKKLEEERKKKEEEKKQKELLKRQREEENERLKKIKEDEILATKLLGEKKQDELEARAEIEAQAFKQQEISRYPHIDEQRLKSSPTKNHILDQLYQAKPRSMSSTSNMTAPLSNQSSLNEPSIIPPSFPYQDLNGNILNNHSNSNFQSVLSPQSSKSLPFGGFNEMPTGFAQQQSQPHQSSHPQQISPWGSSTVLSNPPLLSPLHQQQTQQQSQISQSLQSQVGPPPLQPHFNTGFSPFGNTQSNGFANNTGNLLPNTTPGTFNDPFNSSTVPISASAANGNSVWNSTINTKNNSIWGKNSSFSNGSSSSLWNSSASGIPTHLPTTTSMPGGIIAANESIINRNSESSIVTSPNIDNEIINDVNLIQSAIYESFKLLETSNQLQFGVAPNLTLFQMTKNLLGNNNLTIHQFLNSCHNNNGSIYQFDFIYDDLGTITHIKASSLQNQSQPQSQSQTQPSSQPQPLAQLGLSRTSSFVNNFENLSSTSTKPSPPGLILSNNGNNSSNNVNTNRSIGNGDSLLASIPDLQSQSQVQTQSQTQPQTQSQSQTQSQPQPQPQTTTPFNNGLRGLWN